MTATADDVAAKIWTLIDAIANVNTYDGEFVDAQGRPVTPPVDQDGRIHAYAVFYPSPGWAHAIANGGEPDALDFTFQVTCAGADRIRAMWCIQQVRNSLTGARVDANGQQLCIFELPGTAPIRRDDKVQPPRSHAALQFALNA